MATGDACNTADCHVRRSGGGEDIAVVDAGVDGTAGVDLTCHAADVGGEAVNLTVVDAAADAYGEVGLCAGGTGHDAACLAGAGGGDVAVVDAILNGVARQQSAHDAGGVAFGGDVAVVGAAADIDTHTLGCGLAQDAGEVADRGCGSLQVGIVVAILDAGGGVGLPCDAAQGGGYGKLGILGSLTSAYGGVGWPRYRRWWWCR